MLAGYANLPMLLVLWAIYGSYEHVGNIWFEFGWEMQLLETTLLCAALAHPWDPRPLAARSPPTTSIVLIRWLAFRIMLGAGLIKLRGDPCWRDLTCLDHHFETQPIPNPLSPWFHAAPHAVHAVGVAFNHVVEVDRAVVRVRAAPTAPDRRRRDGRVPGRADPVGQPRVPQLADARADPRVLRRRLRPALLAEAAREHG